MTTDDFVIRKADRLVKAARTARARADDLKVIADAAQEAFDEADEVASDAELEAAEWQDIASGDVTLEEHFELDAPHRR